MLFPEIDLPFEENIVASINVITKAPVGKGNHIAEVTFRNSQVGVSSIGAFKKTTMDCSYLFFMVHGFKWLKNQKRILQNLELDCTRKNIRIGTEALDIEAAKLHEILDIDLNENLVPIDKYQDLLHAGATVPLSSMYNFFCQVTINGILYLFPCTEIARRFLFKTLKLTGEILCGRLFLAAREKKGYSQSTHGNQIEIAEGYKAGDYDTIAKILLDDNYKRLCNKISGGVRNILMYKPKARIMGGFPTSKPFDIEVCGSAFTYNGKRIFMVDQILSDNLDNNLAFDYYEVFVMGTDHRPPPWQGKTSKPCECEK